MQFSLSDISRRFPQTVKSLQNLSNGEKWLERIWELEARWQKSRETSNNPPEVIYQNYQPSNFSEAEDFDIIYAGGTLGLLHATVMAKKGFRVLVFDSHFVGKTHRDWNISDSELEEFIKVGLFTKAEIENAVAHRYQTGFVKFYDGNSRIKTPKLFMDNVLDVAIEADKLLTTARLKLVEAESQAIDFLEFKKVYVNKDTVLVECLEKTSGNSRFFSGRLFIDATGTNSAVSRQLNNGSSITHICPTVGTVATGFVRGKGEKEVDFSVGEILVSTEDISDYRQLIWEGFAGNPQKDEYTTYLFFYDSVDSPADKSLFRLFEDYFEKLPSYKTPSPSWKIVKPVFGYIPGIHHHGWNNQKVTATDRVLLIGDAAGLSSPLTFCGFGSHVRNLRKLTSATEKRVLENALDAQSLAQINAYEPQVAQMGSLAEFMRPMSNSQPFIVNETMNAVMLALSKLDKEIARELFQDRIRFKSFKKVLTQTATLHPKVFKLMFEHLGIKGSFWWIANIFESFLHEKKLKK